MSRDRDILDYALGDASDEQRDLMDSLADDDDELARELDRLGAVVSALHAMPDEAWNDVEIPPLPALTLPADEDRGKGEPGAGESETPGGGAVILPFRRRVSMPRFAAAAAAAAFLVAGIGIGGLIFDGGESQPTPTGPAIELVSFDEGGPDAHGEVRTVSSGGGSLTLDVSGLDPSKPGEIYTLWLIDPEENLLTLGSFLVPEEGATTVTVPLPVSLENFSAVDVSVEEPDGGPEHSGRSVLRGPISGA
jgi:hypothetical protein